MGKLLNLLFGKKEELTEKKSQELASVKLELAKREVTREVLLLSENFEKGLEEKKKSDNELIELGKKLACLKKEVKDTKSDTSSLSIFGYEKIKSEPNKRGLLSKISSLKDRLSKSRKSFISKLDRILLGKKELDEDIIENIEELLVSSDLGVKTTFELIEKVEESISRGKIGDTDEVKALLKDEITSILNRNHTPIVFNKTPFVIVVIGVNGTGKTTTIGKLANKYKSSGKKVLVAAADTFRAAAIEQLEEWAKRADIEIIKQSHGADPAAVVYDAVNAAKSRGVDILLIDTAGRLHTKVNLMEELKKMVRVVKKVIPDAPHEVILVLDGNTGQNAISQAKQFKEAIDVTGVILTKLDGTSKGGIVVAVSNEFKLPIRYIGVGEKIEDLREFNPKDFAEAIFG